MGLANQVLNVLITLLIIGITPIRPFRGIITLLIIGITPIRPFRGIISRVLMYSFNWLASPMNLQVGALPGVERSVP